MRDPEPTPEQLTQASRTLAGLRCRLDEVSFEEPEVAALLEQLSWLQGELRKRRRREQRAANPPEEPADRACYVCKQLTPRRDPRASGLCPSCAVRNETKRDQLADCRGRVALLTGGRVKIGYQVGLKLLRAGAELVATTRFPRDAFRRYLAEPDAAEWSDRLHLVPLDLRCLPAVEEFAASFVECRPRLDVFVHNAAQTIRRPPAFYRHLLEGEHLPGGDHQVFPPTRLLPASVTAFPAGLVETNRPVAWSALLSQVPLLPGDDIHDEELFPPGQLDADGQQVDRRPHNSWQALLPDVSSVELAEVHAVNCLAPFILLRDLLPAFRAGPPRDRFAVLVSSAEGRFNPRKAPRHPHTNMAKAAMNMLVRTTAEELARDRVHLTAVDPGWVSLEFAEPVAREREANGVVPPLDAVDAAARVLDPVFTALNGAEPASGVLLKDYQPVDW
jgi:NAD(P)-dependent dehydrogenase (short-subunit alcohol dehydrogenase family)